MTKITTKEILKYVKNIVFALGCSFILCSLSDILLKKMGVADFEMFSPSVDKDLFYGCVFAPMGEEFIFRWLPITLVVIVFGQKDFDKWKWHFAGILSIIFAVTLHYGYFSIYIQGVTGFFINYVYYKNRKYMYLSGIITHSAWNFSLGYVLPVMSHHSQLPNPFG